MMGSIPVNENPPAPRRNGRKDFDNVPTDHFTQRAYQVQLLEAAGKQNTIVCLGTGTGKTFIPVMLIKELAHQVRRPYLHGGKRTVLLLNSVWLAQEQAQVITLHTDLRVAECMDSAAVHCWTHAEWQRQCRHNHVLIMTSHIFLSLLQQEFITFQQVNLLIMDECENAVKDHPYADIMKRLDDVSAEDAPRILGLTDSILQSKCETAEELEQSISNLERTLHCTAQTASDTFVVDLLACRSQEKVIECADYLDQTGLLTPVLSLLDTLLSFINSCNLEVDQGAKDPRALPRTVVEEIKAVLLSLGPWSASKVAESIYKQVMRLADQETAETPKRFLTLILTNLRMLHKMIDDSFDKEVQCVEDFMKYVSPKGQQLIQILCDHKPDDSFTIIGGDDYMEDAELSDDSFDSSDDCDDDDDFTACPGSGDKSKHQKSQVQYVAVKKPSSEGSAAVQAVGYVKEEALCGLVFVERRYTAFALNKLILELCNWMPDLYFIKSSHITGHSSKSASSNKETDNKKQEDVLRSFRSGEVNLLIATSGMQDALDIPKCNLIMCFDVPHDYCAYIQTKGRARATESKYFMFVDAKNFEKVQENLSVFKGIEKILMNKCHEEEDEPENGTSQATDDYLPPYSPPAKSSSTSQVTARVTMSTAIGLVNRYCAKLPSDAFTHLTPKCSIHKVQSAESALFVATLQLPINSPIKEPIQGTPMPSKKLSQMAVALKTCEILHKNGELDDDLQPVGKEVIKYEDNGEWDSEESMGQARPGTTKRKQYYEKKVSPAFIGQPKADQTCYLYLCDMQLKNPITEEQNPRGRKIHAPEDTKRCFGILTEKEIPLVPLFPVFTRSGEVTVSLVLKLSDVVLSEDKLEKLSLFHKYVFAKVLRLEKYPVVYEPDQAKCSYIVVPLVIENEKVDIDWTFVAVIKEASKHDPRALAKARKKDKELFEFHEEVFQDAVVMPSYRNTDQYFYVAEIRHDLSPQSKFPSPELYDTFYHYYHSKYGLHLTNKKQPLLDVDHTSARLNLLTPRYMNQKGIALPTSSAETRRARRENLQQKQILVPELCMVHPFPASLWRKAVCIPAILYRVNCLLIAEEIRMMIASEAHIGVVELPEGFRFPELDFGFSTKPSDAIKVDTPDSESDIPDESEDTVKEVDDSIPTVKTNSTGESPECTCICELCSRVRQKAEVEKSRDNISFENEKVSEKLQTCDRLNENSEDEQTNNTEKVSVSPGPSDKIPPDVSGENSSDVSEKITPAVSVKVSADMSENCDQNLSQSLSSDVESSRDVGNIVENPSHIDNQKNSLLNQNEIDTTTEIVENIDESIRCIGDASTEEYYCDNKDITPPKDASSSCDIVQSSIEKTGHEMSDSDNENTLSNTETQSNCNCSGDCQDRIVNDMEEEEKLDFDVEEDLDTFIGPSPCTILQTLTMSNANDFFNLERSETIGDSFLKFAITVYLYCSYPGVHEGKLSYLRSKQVSNYNLYHLGKKKGFAERMVAAKFEPTENWLPPRYVVKPYDCDVWKEPTPVKKFTDQRESSTDRDDSPEQERPQGGATKQTEETQPDCVKGLIPYYLQTQQSLPDKSIADCVEALIGCYLTICGQRAALLFMSWLGLKVLPPVSASQQQTSSSSQPPTSTSSSQPPSSSQPLPSASSSSASDDGSKQRNKRFIDLPPPPSPLLKHVSDADAILVHQLNGFEALEKDICYTFRDKAYLLQAFTHASYHYNTVTDCYQRLEFLGDAVLDYVITRHLFEDKRKHSPGILTDLRSALVNNNIFAALAVKWNFHKYFKAVSPQLFKVIEKFVAWKKDKPDDINFEEFLEESDDNEGEDIEIPKALGDIFESVAGAIYLDSGMSLNQVWAVYYRMMKPQIEQYTLKIPKSPVRELLELEPETAKFEKPERTLDGKIRVTVNVVGKGKFKGVGRNYRIAKSAAAKRALKGIYALQQQLLEQQKKFLPPGVRLPDLM